MSPSWRERLVVELDGRSLRLRRLSRGLRPQLHGEQRVALAAATPEAAATALTTALATAPMSAPQGPAPAHARAELLLSGDWVRFALQDQAGALRGPAERQAAAAHALRRIHGDAVVDWQVIECDAGPGMLLAAGIDTALAAALAQPLQQAGARLHSLQPALALAANRCRRWLGQPGWLVSLEPERASIAWCDGRALRSLRVHRARRDLHGELPRWLDQARLLDGQAAPDAPVTLAHRGLPPLPPGLLQPPPRLVAIDALD